MDKSAIKSFAIEARKILMKSAVTQAGFYGVSKDGCAQPTQKGAGFEVYRTIAGTDNRIYGDDIKRREKLVKAVEEKGFDQVIEETAYTWFNRLIAIRFMEVNGYLPTRTRVLSSETGSNTPDLMSHYMDVDLDMTMDELEKVQTCVRENRYDDAFALFFVKQCNALNEILPDLFEKTTDYMELLLKLSYTSDGVVRMLVDTIPESNFDIEQEGQIEIIGWMYQYYNTELKDDTFALLKKNVKITKERIPSATQLFTPDWIVRYMVENSLGRLWVEGHPDEDLKANWKYYLEEAEQEVDVQEQLEKIREEYRNLNPEDIKVIDPCMGSGHILVYCFDVLMQIYESQGYTQRDAARLILENNLYGLDIDKRAAQLSYFAVMMKARQYDRRVFSRGIKPHVYVIEESNGINRGQLKYFGVHLSAAEIDKAKREITGLINTFVDAKEYGSILNVVKYDWDLLERYVNDLDDSGQISFDSIDIDKTQERLRVLVMQGQIMEQKYEVVVTNPPYMGAGNIGPKTMAYIKANYFSGRTDLFAVFIKKCKSMTRNAGFYSMITMQAWMFQSSFLELRNELSNNVLTNLVHLGAHAFDDLNGEVVQTVAFVFLNNNCKNYSASCVDVTGEENSAKKEQSFLKKTAIYYFSIAKTLNLPGKQFAYWISDAVEKAFLESTPLSKLGRAKRGLQTGDAPRFIRYWYEVDISELTLPDSFIDSSSVKWVLENNGGIVRKWYNSIMNAVLWENDGLDIKNCTSSIIPSEDLYFKKCITWNKLTTKGLALKLQQTGIIPGDLSPFFIANTEKDYYYCFGLLNSCVAPYMMRALNPTITTPTGDVADFPVLVQYEHLDEICEVINKCVELSRNDSSSFEDSWEFSEHPLTSANIVQHGNGLLGDIFEIWRSECENRFNQVVSNEEKLNRIFIDIYGLNEELTPICDETGVTIRIADKDRDVRSLISYAVGCMFGRYSLDQSGLVYAGGDWDARKYSSFIPDKDNCIPISDEEYFEDDIVGQFVGWMKKVYGAENLEENLDFIANALGNKGKTSREVIRNYFLNDFIKDHMKIYQKRPIYWMFDSGKQNGFKCLTYMHRYDKDTVGRVRSDYLRKSQEAIEAALKNAEYTIQNSSSAIDKATATKKRDKYIKQLSEIRTYFQALSHVALQRIDIDLDDGVKVNYAKFQNIEIVDENGKKQKINLLTKI